MLQELVPIAVIRYVSKFNEKFCSLQFCSFVCQVASARTQRSMGFGSKDRGTVSSWIFVHDAYIVDRVRFTSAIFRFFFCYFSVFFSD